MAIEINDNHTIQELERHKQDLTSISNILNDNFNIFVKSHISKIQKLIDNAIKKERIAILNSEIDKIKKGSLWIFINDKKKKKKR